jgi:hypothetical protein
LEKAKEKEKAKAKKPVDTQKPKAKKEPLQEETKPEAKSGASDTETKEVSGDMTIAEFLHQEIPLRSMEVANEYQTALETLKVMRIPDLVGLKVTKAELKKLGFRPVHMKRFLTIVRSIHVEENFDDEL